MTLRSLSFLGSPVHLRENRERVLDWLKERQEKMVPTTTDSPCQQAALGHELDPTQEVGGVPGDRE